MHRVTHRGRGGSAQPAEFGRLPSNGFGANVNRPRDTAARKTGETRQSSGPARLSDPGDRTSSEARKRRAGSRLPNDEGFGQRRSRRTGSGSMDDAGPCASRYAGDQEHDRIQPTFLRACSDEADARVRNLNGQVQPGLGEGTKQTGPPGSLVPSLNSGVTQKSIDIPSVQASLVSFHRCNP